MSKIAELKNGLYTYKCTLVRVIDGDTIIAKVDLGFDTWSLRNIRLIDIDAPEIRTKDLQEKKEGYAAKDYLETILAKNNLKDEFYLKSVGYDDFGRSLGHVYTVDGILINKVLVDEGFADIWKK